MSDDEHGELADALSSIRGRAILSGYRTPLYDRLFEGWRRIDAPVKTANSVRQPRRESLWVNFEP